MELKSFYDYHVKKSRAHELLATVKSIGERAATYAERIKKSLQLSMILPLEEEIEGIDDEIFDLESFTLETDLNKGMKQLTKEDCEERFSKIIELRYKKKLKVLELEVKREAFEDLFLIK